jgi:hypothetical protein
MHFCAARAGKPGLRGLTLRAHGPISPVIPRKCVASGPMAFAGIAICQRVAPTGAALHWFFVAGSYIGLLQQPKEAAHVRESIRTPRRCL